MSILYCGAALRDISPKEEWFPFGRSIMGNPFNGILFPLMVRVIALREGENQVLLMAYEMPGPPDPEDLYRIIEEKYGIPEKNVFMFSTHTHSAPFVDFSWKDDAHVCMYREEIYRASLEAVEEALAKMQPVKVGFGFGKSYINVNRNQKYVIRHEDGTLEEKYAIGNNYEGISDKTLTVIRFDDMEDRPVAFFINHPTHATVVGSIFKFQGQMAINGDFPGWTSMLLERNFPESVALWSSGAAGDQNPIWMGTWFGPDENTGAVTIRPNGIDTVDMLKNLSAIHYNDIINLNRTIRCEMADVGIEARQGASVTPGRKIIRENDNDFRSPVIRIDEEGGTYKINVQLLTIGQISLIGIGGELYSSLGMYLKEQALCPNPVIVTHNGAETVGYILDDEGIKHQCHGYDSSSIRPGYVKESLVSVINEMYKDIQGRNVK